MKRGMWWPIAVTAILATTVAANIWVMMIASDDPSFVIEEDYYRKAIAWDSTLAQAARNTTLGWHLTPAMGPIASDGSAVLTAQLTDSLGAVEKFFETEAAKLSSSLASSRSSSDINGARKLRLGFEGGKKTLVILAYGTSGSPLTIVTIYTEEK